ncbi:MAG: Gfo/Idh/MocA family oxidoreductase [Ruminococcaceae bacterium]|nr:Gfo/Idh/MocA family oxidoreductase [Oscillospiraceae bacterium]
MKKYGIAFAGFRHGHIFGLYDAASKNENVNVVSAWEENEEAKNAACENGVVFNCKSLDEMLSDEKVDIVAIGDYYGRRGSLAIKALEAGKHVIADKPLCTSLDELCEIRRLAKEKNLKIGMMLDMRYNKNVLAAKKLVDSGEIGEINNIYFGGQHPLLYGTRPGWYFEDGKHGGTINDISIHGIDIVKNLLGLDVKEICAARTWNKLAKEAPCFKESGQFMLTLSNGAGLIADVSYTAPDKVGYSLPYYWDFKIWGTEGMISFAIYSEKVELYKKTQDGVILCDGIESTRNNLDDLIDDINGKNNCTDGILSCTEEVLKIQRFADR